MAVVTTKKRITLALHFRKSDFIFLKQFYDNKNNTCSVFCIINFIRGRGKLSEPRVVNLGEASTDPEVSLNRWMMSGTVLTSCELQFLHL